MNKKGGYLRKEEKGEREQCLEGGMKVECIGDRAGRKRAERDKGK